MGRFSDGGYYYGTCSVRIVMNQLKYLADLAGHWLERGCDKPDWCDGADLNKDSVVDLEDISGFDSCCVEVITK